MKNDLAVLMLKVGEQRTNCYILYDVLTSNAAIIDPGDDADYIIQKVLDKNLSPKVILATHGHFDHILAVDELQKAFNIPFYMNIKDNFLLKNMSKSAEFYLKRKIPEQIATVNNDLEKINRIKLHNFVVEIIKTPGHTPGSSCFIVSKKKTAFVGDLIFANGAHGETSHSYSNNDMINKSIENIRKRCTNMLIYSGHFEKFILK